MSVARLIMKYRKLLLILIVIFVSFLTVKQFMMLDKLPFTALERVDKNKEYTVNIRNAFIDAFNTGEITAIQESHLSSTESDLINHTACASERFVTAGVNAGLAAILLHTFDHINLCLKLGAKPTVFWRQCGTVCPKDPHVNAWELYFKPINPNIVENARRVVCLGGGYRIGPDWLWVMELLEQNRQYKDFKESYKKHPKENVINLSFQQRTKNGFYGEGLITKDIKLKTHQLITRFIQIQPTIQAMVNEFFNVKLADKVALAVHIRGTDHSAETDERKLTPLTAYIENTKKIMANNPSINRIFVASDNFESITAFIKEFGQLVVFTKAIRARRYDGEPVHDSGMDPYKLGSQVLIDILLMSKCKYFLHGESSVAALVTYFNPDIEDHFVEVSQTTNEKATLPNMAPQESLELDAQEKEEIFHEAYSAFLENSRYSVCPNFQKGLFTSVKKMIAPY